MAEAGAAREDSEGAQAEQEDSSEGEEPETQLEQDEAPDEVDEWCPITDKHEKPFRLMDMPPEIRIEIYRACLTRPFDVLLSKEPKPVDREKEREEREEPRVVDDATGQFVEGPQLSESEAQARLFGDGPDSFAARAADANGGGGSGASDAWPARGMRALRARTRSSSQRSASANPHATVDSANDSDGDTIPTFAASTSTMRPPPVSRNRILTNVHTNNQPRGRRVPTSVVIQPPRAPRPQDVDPLLVNLLRTSKIVYKEARAILYGENTFLLDLDTAQPTLAALHQRSRGQIKNLRVTIPTHNEILERFAEVVRLSIRYCWRLQRFVIHTPFILPGAEGSSTSGNTTVYANAFDILRWLPKKCEVVLEGNVCEEIRRVVERNLDLAKNLDEVSYSCLVYSLGVFESRGLATG